MAGKLTCVNIEVTQASSSTSQPVAGPDLAWQTLDASSNTIFGAKYRKLADGMVVILMWDSVDFVLPVGYRPGATSELLLPIVNPDGSHNKVSITNAGRVLLTGHTGGSGQIEAQVTYYPAGT